MPPHTHARLWFLVGLEIESFKGRTGTLSQPGILGFGLLVDGNVGIGISPEREEILIRGVRFLAGGRIDGSLKRVRAS